MFNILKFMNVPVFFIALALGIFAVYINTSPMRKIVVYPTPDNLDKVQYKDETGTCFSYDAIKVQCPTNKDQIYKVVPQ